MNRQNKRNRKIIISIICGAIVLTMVSAFIGRGSLRLESIFSDSISTIEYYLVKKPIEFVGGIFGEYHSLSDVYSENKTLKKKLDAYASVEANTDILANEINKLKENLKMDYLPSEYKVKNASVLKREATNWSNEITINVGSTGGISEGMVVVDSKGMVGTVTQVTELNSVVSLLTQEHPASQLPIMIINGNQTVYGLLSSYNVNGEYCEMTLLGNIDTLDKEAKVYTSGLGGEGTAPKGIYIGKATKIVPSNNGSGKVVRAKLACDFQDLSYISVVEKVNGNE